MPWIRAALRGKAVFARADARGALAVERGLVEVRYQPHDGRLYRAAARNLALVDPTVLPDDTCGPATEVERKSRRRESPSPGPGTPPSAPSPAAHGSADDGVAPGAHAGRATVVAYTDGACSGNPGPAGLGVVVDLPGRRLELSEYLGASTNNIAELTAILRALEAIESAAAAVVHTDSQYAIGVLQRGWKAKANAALVAALRSELGRRANVRLVYVPGHAGVPLNERADELARGAIASRRSSRRTTTRP
jgi:ribonuclease HI